MRRVLITGANSYIGTSFEEWAKTHHASEISIDTIDMINPKWREKNFSGYDVIFHVAGIAHADSGKENEETKKRYLSVNRDLAVETATKAKNEGVKQFIFMSSILIYGTYYEKIDENTIPKPLTCYASSKFQADEKIRDLADENFLTSILRPPMIYGKNCKGNYKLLSKIAKISPFFPDYKNQRSMLFIENLCEFICNIIIKEKSGIFFPQNSEYVQTSEMVKEIAKVNGHKIFISKCFNFFVALGLLFSEKISKAFGNLVYEKSISEYDFDYRATDFITSIKKTEK